MPSRTAIMLVNNALELQERFLRSKNIGILTFHRVINYGAVLQVFALTKFLSDLGYEVRIIDYMCPALQQKHKKRHIKDIKTIKGLIQYALIGKSFNKKHGKFTDFIESVGLTTTIEDSKELATVSKNFDIIIVGSDQVWNTNLTKYDPAYLLDFATCKKASYAASFGVSSVNDNDIEYFREALQKFNYISVREQEGAEIISKLIGQDVPIVLDPVFLLTKEQWTEVVGKKSKGVKDTKDYIVIYKFGKSKKMEEFAKRLSKENGYKIKMITMAKRPMIGVHKVKAASPFEFLELMINSKYVVTNSFHGTSLSIQLNKEFFVDLLSEKLKVNSRLNNVLRLFHLEDRLVDRNLDLKFNNIDWLAVNSKIEEERSKSVDVLNSIIEN